MENQRNFLFIAMMVIASILYFKWIEFSAPPPVAPVNSEQVTNTPELNSVPQLSTAQEIDTPTLETDVPPLATPPADTEADQSALIKINTGLIIATINTNGGVIEGMELLAEPVAVDQPNKGFPLLYKQGANKLVAQDGLLAHKHDTPKHANTQYRYEKLDYQLGSADSIVVPLTWDSGDGVRYVKTYTFSKDSYVVDITYQIINGSDTTWSGSLYAQFQGTEAEKKGGGFGQLPSFQGAAVYTEEDKYSKISFDDIVDEKYKSETENGWVAMLQHYFVAAWIPKNGGVKKFYTGTNQTLDTPTYHIGYQPKQLTQIAPGESAQITTAAYLGSKEQKRLKKVQNDNNIQGLALTVDYGWLTFIADPLFIGLSFIHSIVGNWGWAIILLTILIKILFYPLSAASYKSMAGMKKLQPRIQTLKDRYKDDRQKFQMEMMALYKKEKINPAGGCLPILIQIPVFIALYWVLLESVELRQAPFALWLQDLSAPDPYYILPVLMGLSMWAQQKLNPAPMDDIQKKVMMVMPVALTFLFLSFPQGLVLYWVVNNVLSIAQQWLINKKHAV